MGAPGIGFWDRVSDFYTAGLYVLARFALYNLTLLYRLLLLCLNLLRVFSGFSLLSTRALGIFPTGSCNIYKKEKLLYSIQSRFTILLLMGTLRKLWGEYMRLKDGVKINL